MTVYIYIYIQYTYKINYIILYYHYIMNKTSNTIVSKANVQQTMITSHYNTNHPIRILKLPIK